MDWGLFDVVFLISFLWLSIITILFCFLLYMFAYLGPWAISIVLCLNWALGRRLLGNGPALLEGL